METVGFDLLPKRKEISQPLGCSDTFAMTEHRVGQVGTIILGTTM